MKKLLLVLSIFTSLTAAAEELKCKAVISVNDGLEQKTVRTEKVSTKVRDGGAFIPGYVVSHEATGISFNFSVEVENSKIQDVSIEHESQATSTSARGLNNKTVNLELGSKVDSSGMSLSCEIN